MTETLCNYATASCTEKQTYPLDRDHVTITVDWSDISKQVQANAKREQPVRGGLFPHNRLGYFLPSFAYAGKNASYICLYPGNWRRKLIYAAGIKPGAESPDPRIVMAYILAHESRHITQGATGYGAIQNMIIFPGLYLALPGAFITAVATLFGAINFWWPLGLLAYYYLAKNTYFNNPREVDARQYAKEHYQEWLPFISAKIIKD